MQTGFSILNFPESVFAMFSWGQNFNLSLDVTIITLFLQDPGPCHTNIWKMLVCILDAKHESMADRVVCS